MLGYKAVNSRMPRKIEELKINFRRNFPIFISGAVLLNLEYDGYCNAGRAHNLLIFSDEKPARVTLSQTEGSGEVLVVVLAQQGNGVTSCKHNLWGHGVERDLGIRYYN